MRSVMIALLTVSLTDPCVASDATTPTERPLINLAEGYQIRLKLTDERKALELPRTVQGRVVALVPEGVRLELGTFRQVTIPARAIESVKVRIGRYPRSRGAAIGAGIGVFLGAGLAFRALGRPCVAEDCYRNLAGFVLSVPVVTGLGAAVGAILPPGDRWEAGRVGVAVSPVIRREGVGLAVAVSF
jgi:hypothetical protein